VIRGADILWCIGYIALYGEEMNAEMTSIAVLSAVN
jgi:hypothetical protein